MDNTNTEAQFPREVLAGALGAGLLGTVGWVMVTNSPAVGLAIGAVAGGMPWARALYRSGRKVEAVILVVCCIISAGTTQLVAASL